MKNTPLNIQQIPIDDLLEYKNNARTHSKAQIAQVAASINEFGFLNPILIDGNKTIIAGHARLAAAKVLKLANVPTAEITHLTKTQIQAYVIADNKLAINAGWDNEILADEIRALEDAGFDVDLIGFDGDELNELLNPEPMDGLTDKDAVPDVAKVAISKEGDIWILGKHRLMCGDSTNAEMVNKLMNGFLADQFVTDPPYNVNYTGKTKEALVIQNDELADTDFREFLSKVFHNANNVMKEGAVFYIWHAGTEGYNFIGACHDTDWKVRQCLIWVKNTMVMGRQDYQWKHEPCLYGWKSGAGHLWNTDRKQVTLLEFNRPTQNKIYPTMKPVDLIEYQIKNNTKGSDIVLDLFGGSGSILIACEIINRFARIMELDPLYCDVIVKRWQEFTGKTATLESTGHEFGESSK